MYWYPQEHSYDLNQYCQDPYITDVNSLENDYSRSLTVTPNLTGVWQGNDGGTYYIHQPHGGFIFWLGLSPNGGRSFTNVFSGNISGGIIQGRWGDVPLGRILSHGILKLHVDTNGRTLKAIHKTGGFGGSIWTKK
ncbi:TPA: hypothetical protein QCY30_005964 [Bacillus toyonensis]|nr:hypothetical protein [Bacillus toyonensis]